MSLASQFRKKAARRKPRINISVVKTKAKDGKHEQSRISLDLQEKKKDSSLTSTSPSASASEKDASASEKDASSKRLNGEGRVVSSSSDKVVEETKIEEKSDGSDVNTFGFNFKEVDDETGKDGECAQETKKEPESNSTFTFNFDVGTPKKSKKKRPRKKKKKPEKMSAPSAQSTSNQHQSSVVGSVVGNTSFQHSGDSDDDDDEILEAQAMHSFVDSMESLSMMDASLTPTKSKSASKKSLAIRTPPGFGKSTPLNILAQGNPLKSIGEQNQDQNMSHDHDTKEEVISKASSAAAIRNIVRRTPGKNLLKKKKKKPLSSQRQAQLKALEEKRLAQTQPTSKMISASADGKNSGKESKKLQFNTSDKGRAMVNHGSLLVHRERNKPNTKGKLQEIESDLDDEDGSSPFSFGFNFNSLLPSDLLEDL